MRKLLLTFVLGVVCFALSAQAADQTLTVSSGAVTATNFNTIEAAWEAARIETGDHTITILENGPYIENSMAYANIVQNVADSVVLTAAPGISPSITLAAGGRFLRIFKAIDFSIIGDSDTNRISITLNNNSPVVSVEPAIDADITVRNANLIKGATNQSVALALFCSSTGQMEITNVSFFGGSPTSGQEVLKTGNVNGGALVTNITNVDFSASDGTGARILLDGASTINVVDSTITSVGDAPAFSYTDSASSPGSNITFRDCSFASGTAGLFDTMGDPGQSSPNIYRLYRPAFTGACGGTMFNIDDSEAEVYVLGLDDSDQPTVPRVDLDPIGTGTTTRIATLRSGKISLQYVRASLGFRSLLTAGGALTANPEFEMIGCEWLNGTGLYTEQSSSGGLYAPRINYTNTLFNSGSSVSTFIQAAGFPRGTTVAELNLTHVTMTGQSLTFMQTEANDIIVASGSIFDAQDSILGVASTRTLVEGADPNVSYCPQCPALPHAPDPVLISGWKNSPPTTITDNPMLDANGRLTAASTAALGLAPASTETLDVDLEARPQPAATANDIGADEASFPPTDIAPDTLDVDEDATVGTLVGTLTVTDPDLGEAFTWFLDDDASGRFVLNNASGTTVDVETAIALDATDSPQTIDVRVRDSESNEHSETLTITINDTTPPVITVTDPATTTIECGDTWIEPGATATDNIDGTVAVTVGGDVVDSGSANLGTTFTITYDAQDAAGNDAVQATREVTVVDTTDPVISLVGGASVTVNCGDGYVEPGVSATDSCEGSVTVTIGGDTFTASTPPGVYTVTYDAQDTTGNSATQVTRTVTVLDNCPLTVNALGATNVGVLVDESHTFEVSISGAIGTADLQWFYDDGSKNLDPIPGATSATLELTDLAVEDSGTYVCQATDDVTVAQSPDFTLSVSVGLTALGPMGIASLVGLLSLVGVRRRKK